MNVFGHLGISTLSKQPCLADKYMQLCRYHHRSCLQLAVAVIDNQIRRPMQHPRFPLVFSSLILLLFVRGYAASQILSNSLRTGDTHPLIWHAALDRGCDGIHVSPMDTSLKDLVASLSRHSGERQSLHRALNYQQSP